MPPEQSVLVGAGQLEVSQGSALSFTPRYLDITVGQTVVFKDIDALEPHTVSFGPLALFKDLAGKDQFLSIPQPGGPPLLAFNPKVALPTMGTIFDGTGYANSGILHNGKSWRLTFTHPGTYEYVCLIHGMAMHGYVVVHPVHVSHPGNRRDAVAASPLRTTSLIDPRLILHAHPVAIAMELAPHLRLTGTMTPDLPGANMLSIALPETLLQTLSR